MVVAGGQAIQPNVNTSQLVHDLPNITSMFPLVGYTSACKELESVSNWQTRRATLRSDQDQTRLCKTMDVFTINGGCLVVCWASLQAPTATVPLPPKAP